MLDRIFLQLYITSGTSNSELALQYLHDVMQSLDDDRYVLEVIDLRKEPLRALQDGIVAAPTLQLNHGTFTSRITGNLSQTSQLKSFLSRSSP
jgi:circadian clock protein KaiB